VTVSSRLVPVGPHLVETLRLAGDEDQRVAVLAACRLAAHPSGLCQAGAERALSALTEDRVGDCTQWHGTRALAENLENVAGDLQDEVAASPGGASEAYLDVLAPVSGAAAVAFALEAAPPGSAGAQLPHVKTYGNAGSLLQVSSPPGANG